jgi:hypothetical protein
LNIECVYPQVILTHSHVFPPLLLLSRSSLVHSPHRSQTAHPDKPHTFYVLSLASSVLNTLLSFPSSIYLGIHLPPPRPPLSPLLP